MIHSIKLQFGSSLNVEPLEFELAPITVFIGPNNSGKSCVLQEIYNWCRTGAPARSKGNIILAGMEPSAGSAEFCQEWIKSILENVVANKDLPETKILLSNHENSRSAISREALRATLENPPAHSMNFFRWVVSNSVLILNGTGRIDAVRPQAHTDRQRPPVNYLDVLARDDEKRQTVRRIIQNAFGKHFAIDPTGISELRITLSDEELPGDHVEQTWYGDAVEFHKNAISISETSDGVRAFTGIITQIVAGDPRVIVIDEPEAFLHPSLSFQLGKEVATAAANANKRIFASTHSGEFLKGCIQSGAEINIVRLTYSSGEAAARILPKDKLLRMMRRPLLRSAGMLSGLFYEAVVVTEGDSDRAFYDEVNSRLQSSDVGRGAKNCIFLNAQNKQTVQEIVRPLRELGIPAAGIVDIDILKDGGQNFTNLLRAAGVPEALHLGLGQTRSKILGAFGDKAGRMKQDGGISLLAPEEQRAANDFFDQLEGYGVFTVRYGELESWLSYLQVEAHKADWLIQVFEKMGESPDSPSYVRPSDNDVWAFIDSIGDWIANPTKGIPPE